MYTYTCSMQWGHLPRSKLQVKSAKKRQSVQLKKTITCPNWQVILWAESSQCKSPLCNRMVGQVKVLVGQVNFRGSLPRLASNVLKSKLHTEMPIILRDTDVPIPSSVVSVVGGAWVYTWFPS